MRIKSTYPQFDAHPAVFAVLGKEKGILYVAHDGTIERAATVEEPAAHYSDREGFFVQSGRGMFFGAGEPYDGNEVQSRVHFIDKVVAKLRELIDGEGVRTVYLFEPEHLKNGVKQALLKETDKVQVAHVAYGTFLNESPLALLERWVRSEHRPDPDDPASVNGSDPNAEEKRKILEVGKRANG